MKKLKIICFSFILYIACFNIGTVAASAAESEDIGNFNFKMIPPENQVGDTGYFNLKMEPNQKQTVQVEMANITDKEVTVEIALNSAKTNSNGVLEFGPTVLKEDASLKYDFKDIVKGPETITIPAKQKVPLNLEITMPADTYDGIITGGIQMQVQKSKEQLEKEKKERQIVNRYAYVLGMVLKETDTKVTPELEFSKFYPELANYRNAVFVNFSNVRAEFLNDMTIDMQVMKKGSDEVLYDTKKTNMRMAPNSMINFPVEMNGERMEPGDYTGHVLVTSSDQKWEWSNDFKITKEDADKYNAQDVTLVQERGFNWLLIGLIAGGVILVVGLVYFGVRVALNKKAASKKRKKKPVKK